MFSTVADFILKRPRLITELHGHKGPVISMAISSSGGLMASGGTDGVRIWDLKTFQEITIPQQPLQERGQISCVLWITRKNETFDTLCYGNALGYLVFLQHRPAESRFEAIHSVRIGRGGEILSLAADTTTGSKTRIATGTRDKCVQVWTFDSNTHELVSVHSSAFSDKKDIVPKVLAFNDDPSHDLYIFGIFDGGLHRYGGSDGTWVSTRQLGSKIGNAAVSLEHRICAIDNVSNGFDIYRLDSGQFVRTLVTREPIRTYPKGVAFANNCQAIIGGSDHGYVYIFERKSGIILGKLAHARNDGVQTITVHDGDENVLIATASASSIGQTAIRLWEWKAPKKSKVSNGRTWSTAGIFEWILKAVVVMAATAYFINAIRNQIGSRVVDVPQMSVDEVKESLRQEMVAEFLGMDTQRSLRREIMTEINTVFMDAGKDAQEYLREEMAAEIKVALMGVGRGPSEETLDARDDFQRAVSNVNIVIAREGDIAPRKHYVGKEAKVLDNWT